MIREVTIGVDILYRRTSNRPRIEQLVAYANRVQWHTLMLGFNEEYMVDDSSHRAGLPSSFRALSPHPETTKTLEAIRLATLIYNDLVVFPLHPISGVRERLALTLASVNIQELGLSASLRLWILMMGAMGTFIPSATHAVFVDELRLLVTDTWGTERAMDWETCRTILRTYLWWDVGCDPVGHSISLEAFSQG